MERADARDHGRPVRATYQQAFHHPDQRLQEEVRLLLAQEGVPAERRADALGQAKSVARVVRGRRRRPQLRRAQDAVAVRVGPREGSHGRGLFGGDLPPRLPTRLLRDVAGARRVVERLAPGTHFHGPLLRRGRRYRPQLRRTQGAVAVRVGPREVRLKRDMVHRRRQTVHHGPLRVGMLCQESRRHEAGHSVELAQGAVVFCVGRPIHLQRLHNGGCQAALQEYLLVIPQDVVGEGRI